MSTRERHPGGRPRRRAGRHGRARRRAARVRRAAARPAGWPSRRPRACSRRSSAPSSLERDDAGAYVAGPLFWLYATRHDPWDELVRLARPTLEQVGERHRRDRQPRGRPRRPGRAGRAGGLDVPPRHPRLDRGRRPAHCSALGKVLYAYGVLDRPSASWSGSRPQTVTDAESPCERAARAGPAPRLGGHRRRARDRADRRRRAGPRRPVARSSRRSASPGPRPRLKDRRDEVGRLLDRPS